MNKYKVELRCKDWRCKHKFSRTMYADDEEHLASMPNPPCPKCKKKLQRKDATEEAQAALPIMPMEQWLEQGGKGPGINGQSNLVKAIDMAAEITMKDYNLTNLKDNIRPGETMAPRLPVQQQSLADNFFAPASNPAFTARQKRRVQMLGQNAIKGAYRNMAVDVKSVLPDSRVAMHSTGGRRDV